MDAATYNLTFNGYWRKPNQGGIPDGPGVYSVYTCRHDASEDTVNLRKLLYIGESDNVRDRIGNHEKWDAWEEHLDRDRGEYICFSFASIGGGRERVEAALIHRHAPPENDEYVDDFPFPETTVNASGENAFLEERFTVSKTS